MNYKPIQFYDLNSLLDGLAKAAASTGEILVLQSPPFSAQQMGASVFLALLAEAESHYPTTPFRAVLDCGDEPGLALNALRLGVKSIRVHLPEKIYVKIADMAANVDATVENRG